MEATSKYLKTNLPVMVLDNLPKIISDTLAIELGSKIQKFETEYEVYDELSSIFQIGWPADTESTNQVLKKQNKLMIEQLAICHGSIRSLESVILNLQKELGEQRQKIEKSVHTHTYYTSSDTCTKEIGPIILLVTSFALASFPGSCVGGAWERGYLPVCSQSPPVCPRET